MKTKKNVLTDSNLNETLPDSEKITPELIAYYMDRGRYLRAEFVANMFAALWQKLKAGHLRATAASGKAWRKMRGAWAILFYYFTGSEKRGLICKCEHRNI